MYIIKIQCIKYKYSDNYGYSIYSVCNHKKKNDFGDKSLPFRLYFSLVVQSYFNFE